MRCLCTCLCVSVCELGRKFGGKTDHCDYLEELGRCFPQQRSVHLHCVGVAEDISKTNIAKLGLKKKLVSCGMFAVYVVCFSLIALLRAEAILQHPSVCPPRPHRTCVVMQMRPAASTLQHHFLIEPFDLWLIPLISSTIFPTECFLQCEYVRVYSYVCVCVSPPFR